MLKAASSLCALLWASHGERKAQELVGVGTWFHAQTQTPCREVGEWGGSTSAAQAAVHTVGFLLGCSSVGCGMSPRKGGGERGLSWKEEEEEGRSRLPLPRGTWEEQAESMVLGVP